MLKVESIVKKYGEFTAVAGVSFEVANGECFGLLGPNGAGKTTTISVICGISSPDSGDIFLNGVSLTNNARAVKRGIGFVPQELALYSEIDAKDNLRFFGSLYGLFGSECEARIEEALELVGLSDRADEPISKFSGGMKRRLNIAAGLLHSPELLVLDEPTVGIDPQSRNLIFETLERLRDEGKTILYTTHYMEEVERLCQRIAIMDHGKVVATGDLKDLKNAEGQKKMVFVQLAEDLLSQDAEFLCTEMGCLLDGPVIHFPICNLVSDIPNILSKIAAKGYTVTALKTSEASLEQVFLTHTGRRLRD
jgi:ABC-2 type transport system ATP-binding protein